MRQLCTLDDLAHTHPIVVHKSADCLRYFR